MDRRLPKEVRTKVKLKKNLSLTSREIFFSKIVFLVEGEIEFGALPIFAEDMDFEFNNNGVTIIGVGGKDNFEIYMKLLKSFDIPYLVMCDGDAVMKVEGGNLPSIFRQLKNLSLVDEKDLKIVKSL